MVTVHCIKMVIGGELDGVPEQAFYMIGTIEEAMEKGRQLEDSLK